MRVGDRIGLSVFLGGVDVTSGVDRVHTRFGFDQRVAECDLDLALTPTFSDWGTLVVQAGLTSIASDTSGPGVTRFNGLAVNNGVGSFFPYTVHIAGRGWLVIADRLRVPNDLWGNFDMLVDPLAIAQKYDPPGIDMTNNGAGQTDVQMINSVLATAGLTGRVGTIGGKNYLLGTMVKAFEQFVWRRGQSALEYIEYLDGMFFFRTYETPSGTINRQQVSQLVPPFYTLQYTLNENVDILDGATIQRDIEHIRNRVEVQGWDDGSGQNVFIGYTSASPLPPGIAYETENIASALIERTNYADPGDGLSCEEVANWWLTELQNPMLQATVSTWRDDPFKPGDIVYLNCPHLLGVNQAMTLTHVECEVTPTTFTQILTLRAQDYAVFRGGVPGNSVTLGAPVLSMALPGQLS